MTFISSEPDIPLEILEAQEEGRLVFFCGAGISYQLGFGDFKWLVDEICKSTGVTLTDEEQQEYDDNNYDRVLNLFERTRPEHMRPALMSALEIGATANLDTHEALLTLSLTNEGKHHIVTTNFDKGFLAAGIG